MPKPVPLDSTLRPPADHRHGCRTPSPERRCLSDGTATCRRFNCSMTAPTPSSGGPCITSPYRLETRRQNRQSVHPPVEGLQRPHSTASAAPTAGPPARRPLLGFPSAGLPDSTQGALQPPQRRRPVAGNVSPWQAARGFCMSRPRPYPRGNPASTQPPGPAQTGSLRPHHLRSQGLGGVLWRIAHCYLISSAEYRPSLHLRSCTMPCSRCMSLSSLATCVPEYLSLYMCGREAFTPCPKYTLHF